MRLSLLRGLLATSVLGLVGVVAWSARHGVPYQVEASYGRNIRLLRAADAELNEQLLKSRSGLVMQYDGLSTAVAELHRLHRELSTVPEFLGDGAPDVSQRLERIRALLTEKDGAVEGFKTQNAVFRNSMHFLPIAAASLVDALAANPQASDIRSRIESLLGAVLLLEIAPEHDARPRVAASLDELKQMRPRAADLSVARDLDLVIAHTTVLLERKPLVDGFVHQEMAVPLTAAALALDEAYSRHHRAALDAAQRREKLGYALLSVIVGLGLLEVISRIQRSAKALEKASSELRRANSALEHEREKERELGEMKTRFVSMTSHEFRTPLSTILSSSELLASYGDRWDVERRTGHLDRIRTAARSMAQMLDDILVIGRAEAGMLKPAPTNIELDGFCRRLIETVEEAQGKTHAIRYGFTGDPNVVLDERLLTHVLTNLVGNAIKYSPAESEVSVQVHANGRECEFLVRDSGIGIPSEDLPHLFESFCRGSNVGQIRGSGLGLAVVKRSLDVLQGSISVKSEVGRGTDFKVTMPRDLNTMSEAS